MEAGMDPYGNRIHYYHASADAFGGRLQRPYEKLLPVLAPTSLPPVGGSASARHEGYFLDDLFSVGVASTQVAGSFDERKGSFTTIVTSVVEDFNVLNVISAKKIVAQITTEHPVDNYYPKVSFIGTEYVGLKVGGADLSPVLNLDICSDPDSPEFPSNSCLYNESFLANARRQNDGLADFCGKVPEEQQQHLAWMQRYRKDSPETREQIARRGDVLCSVVESIDGDSQGTKCGHVIHIPEFGKIFLGELKVSHGSFDLTMVRLEMGSAAQAQVSAGHAVANGTPAGPPHH